MNLRDVKPHTLKRIAVECDHEFDKWFKTSEGMEFVKVDGMNMRQPITPQSLWRIAFSFGTRAILRRVDQLKENT